MQFTRNPSFGYPGTHPSNLGRLISPSMLNNMSMVALPIWADTSNITDIDSSSTLKGITFPADTAAGTTIGDSYFQRPEIIHSEHNGRGWAFLRCEFDVPARSEKGSPIASATLTASAASVTTGRQFVYRAWMDGRFVGLGPTFPIGDEARTDTFDVTEALSDGGRHAIGVIAWTLADQRFVAWVDVRYADGSSIRLAATGDGAWKGVVGNTTYPDAESIGTQYFEAPAENLRAEAFPVGFSMPDFNDEAWKPVAVKPAFPALKPNPAKPVKVVDHAPATVKLTDDGRLIADFGRAWMGGARLSAGTDGRLDGVVRLRFAEVMEDDSHIKWQMSCFNSYQDTWDLRGGTLREASTWGLRVFRYMELVPAEDEVSQALVERVAHTPGMLTAEAIEYPFDSTAADFRCSDPALNEVWRFCRNTIEAFNGPIYADSWTRERAAYEADAWLQQRSHLALDRAPELGRYSVDYLIANRTWPTEWPLYLVLAVHDSWMATGDLTQFAGQYDRIKALLPDRYLDEASGLIVKDPGESSRTDGDLVDWPPAERDGFEFGRVNTVINTLASQAYTAFADMASALAQEDGSPTDALCNVEAMESHGHDDDSRREHCNVEAASMREQATADARHYRAVAERMRKAIHERLWDAKRGAYVDGLDTGAEGKQLDHASEHASAFALAFTDVPPERVPAIGRFLEAKGMVCAPYVAAVMLEGLYRNGLASLATRLIGDTDPGNLHSWHHMIATGGGATMEGWDVSIKGNTTYSHPWSSSPAYLLPFGLLGVKPSPGWASVKIHPNLDGLKAVLSDGTDHTSEPWVRATIPTPHGPLTVHASADKCDVQAPEGVAVTVAWK